MDDRIPEVTGISGIFRGGEPCSRRTKYTVDHMEKTSRRVTKTGIRRDRMEQIVGRKKDNLKTVWRSWVSPCKTLERAVAQLRKELDDYGTEFEITRKQTPAPAGNRRQLSQARFTSTPVPRYSGKSNWEQYREIFEAIVCSNGWDDVTVALQLLSHLDGDALNVALLVPESQRTVPEFLINSLSDHYNSLGRRAEYKHQFQRVARQPGDDPSIFAIELETLARRAQKIDQHRRFRQRWSPWTTRFIEDYCRCRHLRLYRRLRNIQTGIF